MKNQGEKSDEKIEEEQQENKLRGRVVLIDVDKAMPRYCQKTLDGLSPTEMRDGQSQLPSYLIHSNCRPMALSE